MPRFINPVPQYLNSAGDPIVSGEMYFYEIGSVTPKDTYLDAELTIPATNPVLLNADGRLPDTYLLGSYRTVLSEPSTGQIWERDNVGSELSEGYGSEWNSTVTYNIPDVVLYNGSYYQSLTNNNLNNEPSDTSTDWITANYITAESGVSLWESTIQYKANKSITNVGGVLYRCLIDDVGTNPVGDTSGVWEPESKAGAADKINWPTMSMGTDAEHDINFSEGTILSKGGASSMSITATTKQIDAAWSEGDNAGGLFSSVVAANTTYHAFIIKKDSDGSVDAGFDTDKDAVNIPSGYTSYRLLFSFYTDGLANIVPIYQSCDYFGLVDRVMDVSTINPTNTANIVSLSVPNGRESLKLDAVFSMSSSTEASLLVTSLNESDSVTTITNFTLNVSPSGQRTQVRVIKPVNALGQIRYRSNVNNLGFLRIFTEGWNDDRSE